MASRRRSGAQIGRPQSFEEEHALGGGSVPQGVSVPQMPDVRQQVDPLEALRHVTTAAQGDGVAEQTMSSVVATNQSTGMVAGVDVVESPIAVRQHIAPREEAQAVLAKEEHVTTI